jgi:hypothetical protein
VIEMPRTPTPHRPCEGSNFTALKFKTLDRATSDQRLTHLDFRLLYYLASATDRLTQTTRRKQKVIADALGITTRGVQLSIKRLSAFGYVTAETKDGGTYTNAYKIILEEANGGSYSPDAKANDYSLLMQKSRNPRALKANRLDKEGEPPFGPIYPLMSLEIPSDTEHSLGSKIPDAVGARLKALIGEDKYRAWFQKIEEVQLRDGILTLSAPNKFVRDYLDQHFGHKILDAWRVLEPKNLRLVMTARR